MLALLIDGNNMAYRARHSCSLSHNGKDTSVLYGMIKMLASLITKRNPDHVIVAWDIGVPLYRRELIPAYKANRRYDDDLERAGFIDQMNELYSTLGDFGVLQLRRRGIEADDFLHHASAMLKGQSIIVSSDNDLMQSVSDNVSVLKPANTGKAETLVTMDNFETITGVPVKRYVLYKVLQGDSSDNIPGCRGIGPKYASVATNAVNSDRTMIHDVIFALRSSLTGRLRIFFNDGAYRKSYDTINLKRDRTGARYCILNAPWTVYNSKQARAWCMDNGFVSISKITLGAVFGRLTRPEFDSSGIIPYVWDYRRTPLEEVNLRSKSV